jgi:hypothetical protein
LDEARRHGARSWSLWKQATESEPPNTLPKEHADG